MDTSLDEVESSGPEPLNPEIAQALVTLDSNEREYFHERAGIAQYSGGMTRADAEAFALELTLAKFRKKQ